MHFKSLTASVLCTVFVLQTNLSIAAESNFWAERLKRIDSKKTPTFQVASLSPNIGQNAGSRAILKQLPELTATSPLRPEFSSRLKTDGSPTFGALVESLPLTFGSVRDIFLPSLPNNNGPNPAILLIQDVHLNFEAQKNIVGILESLTSKVRDLKYSNWFVGVEGAYGAFDFSMFRSLGEDSLRKKVAGHFLEKNRIAAPSYVGITSGENAPIFVGIDDPAHYAANVEAYKTSSLNQSQVRSQIDEMLEKLDADKKTVLSSQLFDFENKRRDYAEGRISLGNYAAHLEKIELQVGESDIPFSFEQFLSAYKIEKSLDFSKAEAERNKIIERLAQNLNGEDLKKLIAQSLSYQMGRMSFADYYRGVTAQLLKHSIPLRSYPNFDRYVQYVILSDGIKAEDLFESIRKMEKSIINAFATNAAQRQIIKESRHLELSKRLVEFSLTPEEWKEFRSFDKGQWAESLLPFEKFYMEADIRSEKLINNLLTEISHSNGTSSVAAMVVGGFHTAHLTHLLKKHGLAYAVIQPKITKVEVGRGSEYLSIFNREKTPLDKIFTGEKLFLAPAVVQAGHPSGRTIARSIVALLTALLKFRQNPEAAVVSVPFESPNPVVIYESRADRPDPDGYKSVGEPEFVTGEIPIKTVVKTRGILSSLGDWVSKASSFLLHRPLLVVMAVIVTSAVLALIFGWDPIQMLDGVQNWINTPTKKGFVTASGMLLIYPKDWRSGITGYNNREEGDLFSSYVKSLSEELNNSGLPIKPALVKEAFLDDDRPIIDAWISRINKFNESLYAQQLLPQDDQLDLPGFRESFKDVVSKVALENISIGQLNPNWDKESNKGIRDFYNTYKEKFTAVYLKNVLRENKGSLPHAKARLDAVISESSVGGQTGVSNIIRQSAIAGRWGLIFNPEYLDWLLLAYPNQATTINEVFNPKNNRIYSGTLVKKFWREHLWLMINSFEKTSITSGDFEKLKFKDGAGIPQIQKDLIGSLKLKYWSENLWPNLDEKTIEILNNKDLKPRQVVQDFQTFRDKLRESQAIPAEFLEAVSQFLFLNLYFQRATPGLLTKINEEEISINNPFMGLRRKSPYDVHRFVSRTLLPLIRSAARLTGKKENLGNMSTSQENKTLPAYTNVFDTYLYDTEFEEPAVLVPSAEPDFEKIASELHQQSPLGMAALKPGDEINQLLKSGSLSDKSAKRIIEILGIPDTKIPTQGSALNYGGVVEEFRVQRDKAESIGLLEEQFRTLFSKTYSKEGKGWIQLKDIIDQLTSRKGDDMKLATAENENENAFHLLLGTKSLEEISELLNKGAGFREILEQVTDDYRIQNGSKEEAVRRERMLSKTAPTNEYVNVLKTYDTPEKQRERIAAYDRFKKAVIGIKSIGSLTKNFSNLGVFSFGKTNSSENALLLQFHSNWKSTNDDPVRIIINLLVNSEGEGSSKKLLFDHATGEILKYPMTGSRSQANALDVFRYIVLAEIFISLIKKEVRESALYAAITNWLQFQNEALHGKDWSPALFKAFQKRLKDENIPVDVDSFNRRLNEFRSIVPADFRLPVDFNSAGQASGALTKTKTFIQALLTLKNPTVVKIALYASAVETKELLAALLLPFIFLAPFIKGHQNNTWGDVARRLIGIIFIYTTVLGAIALFANPFNLDWSTTGQFILSAVRLAAIVLGSQFLAHFVWNVTYGKLTTEQLQLLEVVQKSKQNRKLDLQSLAGNLAGLFPVNDLGLGQSTLDRNQSLQLLFQDVQSGKNMEWSLSVLMTILQKQNIGLEKAVSEKMGTNVGSSSMLAFVFDQDETTESILAKIKTSMQNSEPGTNLVAYVPESVSLAVSDEVQKFLAPEVNIRIDVRSYATSTVPNLNVETLELKKRGISNLKVIVGRDKQMLVQMQGALKDLESSGYMQSLYMMVGQGLIVPLAITDIDQMLKFEKLIATQA